VWQRRTSADEGLAWLRERLKDAAHVGDGTSNLGAGKLPSSPAKPTRRSRRADHLK
jgi:hypothetical protein